MLTFAWNEFPELETENYILRKMQYSDLDDFFLLRSEKESMQYISRPIARNMQDVHDLMHRMEDLFLKQEGINWVITRKESCELMGTVGFYRMKKEHYRGEVGYQLRKKFFRQGIMYEVLQRIVQYGFEDMHFHTIEADINPENMASKRLLEKSNFVMEGDFKESFYFDGKFYDSQIYSMKSPIAHKEY